MGTTSSKPNDPAITNPITNPVTNPEYSVEADLSKNVAARINQLSDIIKVYNSNDSDELIKLVDKYHDNLRQNGHPGLDLVNIKKNIKEFHEFILKSLDSVPPEQREAKKKELLQRNGLYNVLTEALKKKVDIDKAKLLENTVIQKDPQIKAGIDKIFNNISDIRAKYKYFEHEYINMNLFLVVFIQHANSTMTKFIEDVIRISAERDTHRKEMMQSLIDLLVNIMTKSELDIKPGEFDMINKLMSGIEKQTKFVSERLEKNFTEAQLKAHSELLNPPGTTSNASFFRNSDRTRSVFENAERTRPLLGTSGQTRASFGTSEKPMSPFGNAEQMRSPFVAMRGGFVRDGSIFPQSFYDLSSSKT